MYQVQRKNQIKEQLQLVHANGDIACTLDVDINVDRIGAQISRAYELLGMAQAALQKEPNSPALLESFGKAVIALFTAIFGEEGCNQIVDFYGSRDAWTEMLVDLFPFINNEIIPKVNEASAARKQQLLEMSKALKK
jgi:hypothetical protein